MATVMRLPRCVQPLSRSVLINFYADTAGHWLGLPLRPLLKLLLLLLLYQKVPQTQSIFIFAGV